MNKKGLLTIGLFGLILCICVSLSAQENQANKQPSERIQKGINYLYTGKREEARRIFSGAVANPNDAADAYFYLGLSYYDENNLITAKGYFLKAKELYKAKENKEGEKRAQDFINILSCDTIKQR
ncbi:MAG: tetratricopeptide repeat protein [Candidatus Omnitrophica bacterium]|nr:tetratricopeptide repeat protein [Candidatus Omnitrophota bacterium]